MLAIHNKLSNCLFTLLAANAFAKLSKCQQFTTQTYFPCVSILLQTLLQSYQNVSNSQHPSHCCFTYPCCKRFCKVIKMLAIHNKNHRMRHLLKAANAFAKLSKCQQFTTTFEMKFYCLLLQTLLQSYQNVSNSQQY